MVNTDNLSAEQRKRVETAVRVSEAFRQEGFDPIQYGGATVEFYTQGLYTTGDVDMGFLRNAPSLEKKNQVMASFGCRDSIRLYKVGDVMVDIGGVAELYSDRYVRIETPDGDLLMEAPEEEISQRLLYGIYPQPNDEQYQAARLMVSQGLLGNIPVDWEEARRVAALPGFKVTAELEQLLLECRAKLGLTVVE
jgi:hypothetical protein